MISSTKYKLEALTAITASCIGLCAGIVLIIQASFKNLDDFEFTTGKLERSVLIDSLSIDKDFKSIKSEYLGLKLKSDTLQYGVYHWNLDLQKLKESLNFDERLNIYFQYDKNQTEQEVKQVEQNGIILASFEENRNSLSKSYEGIIFISLIFLAYGLWILKKNRAQQWL
jgi:hypothetical protein